MLLYEKFNGIFHNFDQPNEKSTSAQTYTSLLIAAHHFLHI